MKQLIIEHISLDDLKDLIDEAFKKVVSAGKSEDEFLNIEDASAFTKIPLTTIYDYTSSKKIPFHKKGKKLFFVKQELSQWLKCDKSQEGGES